MIAPMLCTSLLQTCQPCCIADCNRKTHIIPGMTTVGSPCKGREGIAVTLSPCDLPAFSELVVFSDLHELRATDHLQHSSFCTYCRNSSVGVAAGYVLYGPVIESRWSGKFPHFSRLVLVPTQPPVRELFTGGKPDGARR